MKKIDVLNYSDNTGYEIYCDGVLLISAKHPIRTYQEVISELFNPNEITVNITSTESLHDFSFRTGKQNNDINSINEAHINFQSKLEDDTVIVNDYMVNSEALNKINKGFNPYQFTGGKYKETFTGTTETSHDQESDDNPLQPGQTIYVDNVMGTSIRCTGGLAVVLGSVETENGDIMVEVESMPGVYYSWNELEPIQEQLEEQFKLRPAFRII